MDHCRWLTLWQAQRRPWEADLRLDPPQLPRADLPPLRRYQITQAIRRVIAARAIESVLAKKSLIGFSDLINKAAFGNNNRAPRRTLILWPCKKTY